MELEIWKGDWGLPSVDLHCLEALAYAKFSGAPVKVVPTNNPFWTSEGRLPVFRHDKKVFHKFTDVSQYLRQKKYSADYVLTSKQCAEVVAYTQMLSDKLYPALQYAWWVDAKNYVELSRPWYAKALAFPLNYYYPGRYERESKRRMETMFNVDEDEARSLMVEREVYGEAEKCMTLLSERLGEKDFFFGASPSSLDATVFGHLAPLLKAPFPNPALQSSLKGHSNLVRYVVRILQRYFPSESDGYESTSKQQSPKSAKSKEDDGGDGDYPHKRRNQVLAGMFATTAMVMYALVTGLVQVTVRSEEDPEDLDDIFTEPRDDSES